MRGTKSNFLDKIWYNFSSQKKTITRTLHQDKKGRWYCKVGPIKVVVRWNDVEP